MIFINYRTSDESMAAGLLKSELSRHFTPENVFLAGTDISAGTDFEQELLARVRGSRVLLATIGTRWLTAPGRSTPPSLRSEEDWVRREIAEAIRLGVRVIPILVGATERLTDADLPADIAAMRTFQHLRLRHDNLNYDLARIVDELTRLMNPAGPGGSTPAPVHMTANARGKSKVFQSAGDQVFYR